MRHGVIEAQVKEAGLDAHHRKLIADYLALPDTRDTGLGMVASGGLSRIGTNSHDPRAVLHSVGYRRF